MSQKEHTPGPWRAIRTGGALEVAGPVEGVLICRLYDSLDDESDRADAHLIAAAPDLLAACEQVADALEYDFAGSISVEHLRALIAKARGEG